MAAPRKTHGAGSFATLLIVGPVCFFLGILFAQFPYDFPLLWTKAPITTESIDQITAHINFILESPPLIGRLLNIVLVVGLLGFLIKLFNPTEANVLFDGASLVLYLIGAGIYLTNIMKGLRAVKADIWSKPGWETDETARGLILGKEDSLKVLSASNTILALILAGVLVLQAGQWYAESKEKEEQAKIDKEYEEKLKAAAAGGPSKKKQ